MLDMLNQTGRLPPRQVRRKVEDRPRALAERGRVISRAMRFHRTVALFPLFALAFAGGAAFGRDLPRAFCRTELYEEQVRLDDTRLALDDARSVFAAFEEIYELIAKLWENDATERMIYLRAKYDRDAAEIDLQRAELIVARQTALLEQLRSICATGRDSG